MRFQPLTDEELLDLLPDGEYNYLTKAAENQVSKSGNEMIKLTLTIYDANGREHPVYDYLLDKILHKVKHYADSNGLEDMYAGGGYNAEDCVNRAGKCKIGRSKGDDGYAPKNIVKDYIKRQPNEVNPLDNVGGFSDEIPF